MKIYIISRGYPSVKDPQWGCFEKDQALALQQLGYEIVFLSIDKRSILNFEGLDYKYENKFHIYNYKSKISGKLLSMFSQKVYIDYFSRIMLNLFDLAVKKHGLPDIIYAHYQSNIAFVQKIKEKYGIPIIGMEHWSVINKNPLPKSIFRIGKMAYDNADVLISVSNSLKNRIKQVWKKDSVVIHNMVGCEFEYIEKKRNDGIFRFVSVGNLIKRKGFDLLIEAFSNSDLCTKKVKIIIIGDGKERDSLKELISRKGLSNYIELVGSKTKAEIVDYLSQCDAFVLPSRSETFGVVYIEAMMLGLPVIGTRCGGPEEFITEDNGLLLNINDINGLTDALIKMHDNIFKYNRKQISEKCRENFSADVISNKLSLIFNKVIINN